MKFKYNYYVHKGKDDYDKHGHPIFIQLQGIIEVKNYIRKINKRKYCIDEANIFYKIDRELAFKYAKEPWRIPFVLDFYDNSYKIKGETDMEGNYFYNGKFINTQEEIQNMIKKINNPNSFNKKILESLNSLN